MPPKVNGIKIGLTETLIKKNVKPKVILQVLSVLVILLMIVKDILAVKLK